MIIVAGASGDIGNYIVKRFVEENFEVTAVDKTFNEYYESPRLLRLTVDLSDEESLEELWPRLGLAKEFTFINLIGNIRNDPLLKIFHEWTTTKFSDVLKKSFEDNFFNVALTTMSLARFAFLSNLKANIINFGSISSKGVLGQIPYGSAKGAVQSFSRIASIELGSYGVRTNCIIPGYVDTPNLSNRISKERISEVIEKSSLHQLVSLEDIYLTARYLHHSRTINGAILEVHSIHGL